MDAAPCKGITSQGYPVVKWVGCTEGAYFVLLVCLVFLVKEGIFES